MKNIRSRNRTKMSEGSKSAQELLSSKKHKHPLTKFQREEQTFKTCLPSHAESAQQNGKTQHRLLASPVSPDEIPPLLNQLRQGQLKKMPTKHHSLSSGFTMTNKEHFFICVSSFDAEQYRVDVDVRRTRTASP